MRWLGLLMFIGGGALAYFSVISPLLAASRHEEDVSISLKAVVLTPALVVIGLILFCIGNERAGQLLGTRKEPKAIGGVIAVVIVGIGILLYQWLKSRLRAYGYSF
jgi:hypothetical protein